jgi:hypothetical protein
MKNLRELVYDMYSEVGCDRSVDKNHIPIERVETYLEGILALIKTDSAEVVNKQLESGDVKIEDIIDCHIDIEGAKKDFKFWIENERSIRAQLASKIVVESEPIYFDSVEDDVPIIISSLNGGTMIHTKRSYWEQQDRLAIPDNQLDKLIKALQEMKTKVDERDNGLKN